MKPAQFIPTIKTVLLSAPIFFFACQSSSTTDTVSPTTPVEATIDQTKVSSLIARTLVKEASEAEQQAFINDYRSMSGAELAAFNKQQIEAQATRMADKPEALAELKNVLAMRETVNAMSMKSYGVSYNQLDPTKMDQLMDTYEANEAAVAAKNGRAASCNAWFFDRSYPRGTVPKLAADYIARVNAYPFGTQPNTTNIDCDCRVGFQTTAYSRVVSASTQAGLLLSAFNNVLSGRVFNGATYLIVGQKRANIIYAGFGCSGALYDLRMGNP